MKDLIRQAITARENAYAPYSGYRVGAALRTKGGRIYTGCNIENAAFSPSCCAERVSFYNAVSCGEHDFEAIAIVGGPKNHMSGPAPCGVCRQVMAEFCDPYSFQIIMAKSEEDYETIVLEELLPRGFSLPSDKTESIKKNRT